MNEKVPTHYVCTHEKAWDLVKAHNRFWVSICGCREARGQCSRSRMDVCLMFAESDPGSDSGRREITFKEVEDILQEAQTKHLVARPFRNGTRTATIGICFCCDDCCGFFLDPTEKCDKGALIEETDLLSCELCGTCAEVCYFKARDVDSDGISINRAKCYGCGLCADVCPEGCIQLIPR